MFRSARWRSEKNKIKAVFKLQFHATQVEEDALTISVVPEDVGKPTARLEKALVRDGSCYWEEPVYETMKFTKEARTGKMNVKIYSFVVSKITHGTSKPSVVGEASIDFASYVEATKISSVSLPLNRPKSDVILHVKIQRVLDNDSLSEIDETDAANVDSDNAIEVIRVQLDSPVKKMNRRVSSGSDLTITSSFSSSGIENVLQNSPSHQRTSSDLSTKIHGELQKSQWETSTDDSLGGSSTGGDVLPTDITIEKLKSEVTTLSRQASLSDLELQTLRKQIIKERKRSHDLAKEVAILKEEKEAFKQECVQYKAFHKRMDEAKAKDRLHFDGGNPIDVLEELRQELNYEKDLNANLRLQLSKTQESNSELILEIRELDETLERQKTKNNAATKETDDTEEDDEEQRALEKLVNDHLDSRETHVLEQKISDLCKELQIYRRDKDELEMQIEQIALDYEILKQENHDLSYKLEQSQIQEQLKMQYECSSSYSTMNELESQIDHLEVELKKRSEQLSDSLVHIQSLEEEIEKQAEAFVEDLEKISQAKIEQEQRAIKAEESLRKTRLQNANTAEKLQEEFRRLSVQMTSTFEANEVLATKAMAEASQLRFENRRLEEQVKKDNSANSSSNELQKVRKKNKEMEQELKEMQERYSEISLKFAEVEGERQQLIMTLRLFKNPKKI